MAILLKSGAISEAVIQKTVMKWVINLHPEIARLVFHFPNEGRRTLRYGKLLKDMGMRAGVADLFIATARHGFHGAWIELKSQDGTLQTVQKIFLNDMKEQGYFTAVCRTIERAIEVIDWYFFKQAPELARIYMYNPRPIDRKT